MPKRVSEKVDPQHFFRKGESFFYLAQYVNHQGSEVVANATFAFITCYAFAAEVYLKVLAQLEKGLNPLETHNLRHLFNDLSRDSQERIRLEWTDKCRPGVRGDGIAGPAPAFWTPPQTFDQALDKSARAFVDWRYFYSETEPLYFHMIGLPAIVRKMILERRPEWRQRMVGGVYDPKSEFVKPEKNQFIDIAFGSSVLNRKPPAFNVQVRRDRSSDTDDDGTDKA